jgi:Holliday junction resolvase YEN1
MGIHGVFKEIATTSERVSLAKYSAAHFATHGRPLVLAVDIAIWLFQIQSGKGGSNPALRTFYYRLLRLLSLNIHPIFVFDGPNKPQWKRNKKVGGPGVRVVSVPEFLAKQLLKLFGFPIHIAPGEAEAECALLQKTGIVDAVMSEDVDTLMFGSAVLVRNWSSEGSSKTPTHVTVYRAQDAKARVGIDPEGMILIALMSGGDYVVEGIPGCGIKVACDAARAGFAHEMCKLAADKDTTGLQAWRERLQHEIRTNESKFFSRRNGSLVIPADFPRMEILGYYTRPRVSSSAKLAKLKDSLVWDQVIDFPALRLFAGEAFDWRCIGGAKKLIKNLAPAMLVRELRLRGDKELQLEPEAQQAYEKELIIAIHGERKHSTTDGELEYRVSFTPLSLVPINLSIEEEDDPVNGIAESDSDIEVGENNAAAAGGEAPPSPTKSRQFRPYFPEQPEKIWIAKAFLQPGIPLLIEDHEARLLLPKTTTNPKKSARAVGSRAPAKPPKKKRNRLLNDMPVNTMHAYTSVTKNVRPDITCQLDDESSKIKSLPERIGHVTSEATPAQDTLPATAPLATVAIEGRKTVSSFRRPEISARPAFELTDLPPANPDQLSSCIRTTFGEAGPRGTQQDCRPAQLRGERRAGLDAQGTPPRRKRVLLVSPSPTRCQRTISSYYSPSPKKAAAKTSEMHVIDLLSSSPVQELSLNRPVSPSPNDHRRDTVRQELPSNAAPHDAVDGIVERRACSEEFSGGSLSPSLFLPAGVTPRSNRRKRAAGRELLTRAYTAPTLGCDDDFEDYDLSRHLTPKDDVTLQQPPILQQHPPRRRSAEQAPSESIDLMSSSLLAGTVDQSDDEQLASPSSFMQTKSSHSRTESSATAPAVVPPKKKAIILRQSLVGTFREVDVDAVDLSGDGSGWKASGGKASVRAVGHSSHARWRRSAVEILDLTGA